MQVVNARVRHPHQRIVIAKRRPRTPIWDSTESFLTDLGVFILGVSGAFNLNLVGQIPGDEVILFPILPLLLLAHGKRAFTRQYLWFYVVTGAWLFGTLVADIYAGSPAENRMKGTARVVFFALDFLGLAVILNNNTRRMIIFSLSIAAVMLYDTRLFLGDFLTQWKFGYSGVAAIIALLGSSYFYEKRKYWVCVLISVVLAGLNLDFAYRSQLGVHMVSAALILPLFNGAKNRHGGQNRLALVMLLALAGASLTWRMLRSNTPREAATLTNPCSPSSSPRRMGTTESLSVGDRKRL